MTKDPTNPDSYPNFSTALRAFSEFRQIWEKYKDADDDSAITNAGDAKITMGDLRVACEALEVMVAEYFPGAAMRQEVSDESESFHPQ
jgi:hypothetical protein